MRRGSLRGDVRRPLYKGLGFVALGLGAIGAALPIMPTVPFLLLAVYFFARSSPELEQRILDHPHWGPHVKDWRERRAISRRSKTMAIGAMATGRPPLQAKRTPGLYNQLSYQSKLARHVPRSP